MRSRVFLACIVLAAGLQPARADVSADWFTLKPDDAAADRRVPAGEFFYDRVAPREGLARLKNAYDVNPQKPGDAQLSAGTLLYKTHAAKDAYYCSARGVRRQTSGEMLGGALVTGLSFGFAATAPREASQQCFRDKDSDGFFDEAASGVHTGRPLSGRLVVSIQDANPLPAPVAYELADPESAEPPLEVGLSAKLRSESGDPSFDVDQCMRTAKGEFAVAETYCFPSGSTRVRQSKLPAKINFLDGEITITDIARDDQGWKIQYSVTRPVKAVSISVGARMVMYRPERFLVYLPAAQ
ncbi:MAG: hypothetical protein J0I19_17655 [Alphaproteobacteria bacterium]|nr:hypothetical protein [Alphaproteobacteria bacterium]